MARLFSRLSVDLLKIIDEKNPIKFHEIVKPHVSKEKRKSTYDALYRMLDAELIELTPKGYQITPHGTRLIHKLLPVRDGVWKLIIFHLPESKRKVRGFLRSKLKSLGFKKWQNSVWISPYVLDEQIENELNELASKYFIRLIKTREINYASDLDKLFPDQ